MITKDHVLSALEREILRCQDDSARISLIREYQKVSELTQFHLDHPGIYTQKRGGFVPSEPSLYDKGGHLED